MIFATYTATVDAAASEPSYTARAQLLNTAEHETATVDNAAAQAILVQPRLALAAAGDTVPLVSGRVRWLHDGADPATGEPIGPVTVTADLLDCSREWKWPLAASRGSSKTQDLVKNPLGYEIDRGAPPPGPTRKIDVVVDLFDYSTPALVTAKLINGGRVRTSERVGSDEEHALALTGGGFAERYARRLITLNLEADHGLTHGEIAVLACQLAGVPDENILIDSALGEPRTRKVDLSCVTLWSVLKDVLAPIGYRPNDSRDPRGIAAFPVLVDETGPVVATLNQVDIDASAGFGFAADATVAACVRVTGTDPTQREVPLEGTVTTTRTVETFTENYVLKRAVAVQDLAGNVTTLTPGGDIVIPGLTLTERVTFRQTFTDGCLVRTRTTQEAFRLIEHIRYTTSASADGTPFAYHICYFYDEIPVKDDAADACRLQEERFIVVFEEIVDIIRDAAGREVETITRTSDFGWPEAAIKNRAVISTDWGAVNYSVVNIQGNGTAREIDHETWFAGPDRPDVDPATYAVGDLLPPPPGVLNPVIRKYLRQSELERIPDSCGQEIGTVQEDYALGLAKGLTQLYADGQESKWSEERGRLEEITRETRVEETDTSHTALRTGSIARRGSDLEPKPIEKESGVQGALPNIPQCLAEAAAEEGGTEFSAAVCLQRAVEGDEANPFLEEGAVKDLSSPFVESEDEARTWAEIELELEAGIRVSVPLTYTSPIFDIGKTLVLDVPDWGFASVRVVVENHENTIGDDGKLVDRLLVRPVLLE